MLTWTALEAKAVRQARDVTLGTLIQLKEDMNTGYHLFNAKLSRYFSRKQQFTDVKVGQSIYQVPLDSIRISNLTIDVDSSGSYKQVVQEIRSEDEWRVITAYPYASNWPTFYFNLGNDKIEVWPTASQDVTQGMRFVYQQQDNDLTVEDVLSTPISLVTTVANSTTVTAASAIFLPYMKGLKFQLTGLNDQTWYDIIDVPTTNTLTLKSAFIGGSGSGLPWKIGQVPIIPQEYHPVIVDYALALYYSSKGNETRANIHMQNYDAAVSDATEQYSSSNVSSIITDDPIAISAWTITPLPGI